MVPEACRNDNTEIRKMDEEYVVKFIDAVGGGQLHLNQF